jgi:hypothetical protein
MGAYRERQRGGRAGQGRHGGGCMVTTFLFAPAVLCCFLGKKKRGKREKEEEKERENEGIKGKNSRHEFFWEKNKR